MQIERHRTNGRRAVVLLVTCLGMWLGGVASARATDKSSGAGLDVLAPADVAVHAIVGFDLPGPLGVGVGAAIGLPLGVQVGASISSVGIVSLVGVDARARLLQIGEDLGLGVAVGYGARLDVDPAFGVQQLLSPLLVVDLRFDARYGLHAEAGPLWADGSLHAGRIAVGGRMPVGGFALSVHTGLMVWSDGEPIPIGGLAFGRTF